MFLRRCLFVGVILFFLGGKGAFAKVVLSSVLSDHMVVQRGRPVHLWGMATPNEAITAEFRGDTETATADAYGRWSLYLQPRDAGGPFTMTVRGANDTITWRDVLVGDVWIASGQSNMEFPMLQTPPWTTAVAHSKEEIAAAEYPLMRLLHVSETTAAYPMPDAKLDALWSACTPETIANFSAVAYFFGRELLDKEHVPIGLVEAAWGGTPAESWTSLDALSADASLIQVFRSRAVMQDEQPTVQLQDKIREEKFEAMEASGQKVNRPWHLSFDSWEPAALYNGMIAPLTPMAIRGVIWYQGESNTNVDQAPIYQHLFETLIMDWRTHWTQGDFPFLFVQIANYAAPAGSQWPEVRDAQRRSLEIANTGMVVTIDIGNERQIHPANKQEVGRRLGLLARAMSYGEAVEDSGPLVRQTMRENGAFHIYFDHAQSGLAAHGEKLTGFEIAGDDGRFLPADAGIDGDMVVVFNKDVPQPKYVRYAWASTPDGNLYNKDGLPASPFRSN